MSSEMIVKRKIIWRVENFTREGIEKNVGKRIKTGSFTIEYKNVKTIWDMAFDAYSRDSKEHCGFYLYKIQGDIDDVMIKLNVGFQTSEGKVHDNRRFTKKMTELHLGWGWAKHIKINRLFDENYKFVVNNAITFIVDLELYKDRANNENNVLNDTFALLHAEHFNSERYSDFTFISSDNVKIPVHRCVVAARSKVLDTMFSTRMIENKTKQVKLHDIDGETMTEMLRYIYTGNVENIDKTAFSLLFTAQKYDIHGLKSLCIEALIKQLSQDNVVETLLVADQCEEKVLMEICIEFIKRNLAILKTSEVSKIITHRLIIKIMESFKHENVYIISLQSKFPI